MDALNDKTGIFELADASNKIATWRTWKPMKGHQSATMTLSPLTSANSKNTYNILKLALNHELTSITYVRMYDIDSIDNSVVIKSSGWYSMIVNVSIKTDSGHFIVRTTSADAGELCRGGSAGTTWYGNRNYFQVSTTVTKYLAVGDRIQIMLLASDDTTPTFYSASGTNTFSIYRV